MTLTCLPGCGAPAATSLGVPPCPVCDYQTPPEPEDPQTPPEPEIGE